MKQFRLIVRAMVFGAALAAGVVPAASALQINPTYQIFQLKSGGVTEGQLTLTNTDNKTLEISPEVKDWFRSVENKKIPATDFLEFVNKAPFMLKPNESKVVKFKVSAPKGGRGELIGALSFGSKAPGDMITLQLTVVMYVAVEGTENLNPKITGLSVNISSNTDVGVLIKNNGNVHSRPLGWVYVDDESRQRVLSVEIPQGHPVFPGEQKSFSKSVKGFSLPQGRYTARIEMMDADRDFRFPVQTKRFTVTPSGTVEVR